MNGLLILGLWTFAMMFIAACDDVHRGGDLVGRRAATCQGQTINPQSSDRVLCSKTFYGRGTCTGDTLAVLQDSAGFPNAQFVHPWESSSTSIIGIITVDLIGNVDRYASAGNSYNPDIMHWHNVGTRTSQTFYSAGMSFQFPPRGSGAHIDLHVFCTGGAEYEMQYTIFYTVP
jgi:hypothetical protein